jgi:hypothetical protein
MFSFLCLYLYFKKQINIKLYIIICILKYSGERCALIAATYLRLQKQDGYVANQTNIGKWKL